MKILVADDSNVSRRLLASTLARWGYDVVEARDGTEAMARLTGEDPPRLAVVDWMMPGLDGPALCRALRKARREPYTYVLLLTARGSKDDLIAGLDAGADDYLSKPFDHQELRARLRTGRRILELEDELVAAREALREEARHDALTGLLARGAVLEILERELARARREARPVAVVLLDLDRFKRINDERGHLAGDAVLEAVAKRIRGTIRAYDAAGRYGGEEILIVLPGADADGAGVQAERIRALLASEPVSTPVGPLAVTASFGVAASTAERPLAPAELLAEADRALYRAKKGGRNRVALAEAEPAPA